MKASMRSVGVLLCCYSLLVQCCIQAQKIKDKPNIIIVQADDLNFLEAWEGTHVHFDNDHRIVLPRISNIPNIEYLRKNGLQMKQAHTASPMCGTSRYSTISGRYPSRSSRGRLWDSDEDIRNVEIPRTKLLDTNDISDGQDCSRSNIAQAFKSGGYRTGMVGKWHLSSWHDFDYSELQDTVRACGFDVAEAVYPHNPIGEWASVYGYEVEHNMEHVAAEAISFIDGAVQDNENFFLYLNPTVPHVSSDVSSTLEHGDCRQSVAGWIPTPRIPRGKYSDLIFENCTEYRQTVRDRADTWNDKELGMIWIDDAMGWIMDELQYHDILHNTFILFQQDHGQEGKGTLFEQGVHIAQFIHYPEKFPPGSTFDGLVSTIDIGPTVLDIAGITPNYKMDGKSWANAAISNNQATLNSWRERCIFYELQQDRVVQCGCDVYMRIIGVNETSWTRSLPLIWTNSEPTLSSGEDQLYNMCANGDFIYSPHTPNPQEDGEVLLSSNPGKVSELSALVDCHLRKTEPEGTPDYDTQCALEKSPPTSTDEFKTDFTMAECLDSMVSADLRPTNNALSQPEFVSFIELLAGRNLVQFNLLPQPVKQVYRQKANSDSTVGVSILGARFKDRTISRTLVLETFCENLRQALKGGSNAGLPASPKKCENVDRFTLPNGKYRRCTWVAARKDKRCLDFSEECPETCGSCPDPNPPPITSSPSTAAPTSSPTLKPTTAAPTSSPSMKPTPADTKNPISSGNNDCEDVDWFQLPNGNYRRCWWVSLDMERRCAKFGSQCPVTCGTCT